MASEAIHAPGAEPNAMRPKLGRSCVMAPKLLSTGSLLARKPLPVLTYDNTPPALELWRAVAFEGSRSSARE
eukprot:4835483-Pleurochrysis_carterae.AAC.4